MARRLAELKLPEIDAIGPNAILVQPVGSIEQHGPHLPFDTDLVIASRVADELISAHGEELDVWLLPPLAYSKSNEHAWAAGTIWLSARTLLSVVEDIGRSVAAMTPTKLVFLNGHGGNSALLEVACRELRIQHGLQTFLAHPMVPPDQGGPSSEAEAGMGVHGGHLETSLMLHLAPDSVDMTAATSNVPDRFREAGHVGFGRPVSFGWTSDDFGREGHIGDPTGASASAGARAFEAAVRALGEALGEIAELPL